MNLGAMIQQFRTLTRDTVRRYMWQDSELAPWFSEAETEAAIRSRLIFDAVELDVSAGDTELNLPVELFDIEYAELRDAAGKSYQITARTRDELRSINREWRTTTERPEHFVHDAKRLVFSAIADAGYTLYLEFYRTPRKPLAAEKDEPELQEHHHAKLVEWVMFRAYSKPDSDTMNPQKAKESEDRFESYFGRRPSADLRRRQNANKPHRNRLHQ